jgi:subtilisin family serine protease
MTRRLLLMTIRGRRATRSVFGPALVLAAALLLLTVEVPGSAAMVASAATGLSGQERHYLVAGQKNALPDRGAIAAAGGTWVDEIASIGIAIVRSSNPDFRTLVKGDRSVALASPDFEAQIPAAELSAEEEADLTAAAELAPAETQEAGDPLYHLQWPHVAMGVAQAHPRGITGEGVRVAVVDSGIDCLHEDLRDRCLPGKSFVPLADGGGYEDPWDATNPHGTAVAGIIAATANNGKGVRGIAPEASLISVKVSPASGERFPWHRVAQAFDWASSTGQADIINASFVVRLNDTVSGDTDPLVGGVEEIRDFLGIANRLTALVYRRGGAIFAAAGNDGMNVAEAPEMKLWPAEYAPRVVAVGGTTPCGAALDGNVLNDYYDDLSSASNYGFDPNESQYLVFPSGSGHPPGSPQCFAPRDLRCQVGSLRALCRQFDQVLTTARTGTVLNGYTVSTGTSTATPHASGLAALILSRYPDMKVGELTDTVLNTAIDLGAPGYDPIFGYGRGSAAWLK